jgi:beta-glucosidase
MKHRSSVGNQISMRWIVLLLLVSGTPLCKVALASNPACPWMDTSKTPDERANLLLNASTLQQIMRWLNEASANETNLTVFGNSGTIVEPAQVPCATFASDDDGPGGVAYTPNVTAFPVPIAQTASWDKHISWEKGKAQGDEAFRELHNILFGPGIDLERHPWNGRNSEYMGEDPLLAGTLAGVWIRALREATPGEPVGSVIKHFVGNDQETDRAMSSSNIDPRTIHELNDLPFEIAIAKGNPAGVMCSYNQVNGIYSCQNPTTLTEYLRGEMGFKGYVTSDNGGLYSTAPSLLAGTDMELSQPNFFSPANLQTALTAGEITEDQIRAAAFRVVRTHIAQGLFDNPLPATAQADVRTPEHLAIAQRMAEEGSVLLKNTNKILPIKLHGKTIAVIGPTASNTATNGVSASTVCTYPEFGLPIAPLSIYCPTPIAPLDAITARAAENGDSVIFDNGSDLSSAATTAANADVAIVFGYNTAGEYFDLTTLNLFSGGDALIEAVVAANPKTVVVLETSSPVLMPWVDSVPAIFEAWHPGVQQGNAIAALLFGDVNFSGKLPVSFSQTEADLPTGVAPNAQYPGLLSNGSTTRAPGDTSIRQVEYSEGLLTGYRWYDTKNITPLFPFGYGLSYTTFKYEGLEIQSRTTWKGDDDEDRGWGDDCDHQHRGASVTFKLTNSGKTAGAEVAEVYLSLPNGLGEPVKRLAGWARVPLNPGESKWVTVKVPADSAAHLLSYWNPGSLSWKIPSGKYVISVGSSSRDLLLQASLQIHSSDFE